MDLAYAAADLVLGRSGAMTVAELGAVGLPAVYVPLPHGNGEQRLNASAQIAAGSAVIIEDADLTPDAVANQVIPLLTDPARRDPMRAAAVGGSQTNAGDALARIVYGLAAESRAHRVPKVPR
jgi:UDP-N-acetylglucosamine--N-acetylmuramyl-(pentapeptide) pyrophosphoryl-undecaprenol N-acetylglucosamine transferase